MEMNATTKYSLFVLFLLLIFIGFDLINEFKRDISFAKTYGSEKIEVNTGNVIYEEDDIVYSLTDVDFYNITIQSKDKNGEKEQFTYNKSYNKPIYLNGTNAMIKINSSSYKEAKVTFNIGER